MNVHTITKQDRFLVSGTSKSPGVYKVASISRRDVLIVNPLTKAKYRLPTVTIAESGITIAGSIQVQLTDQEIVAPEKEANKITVPRAERGETKIAKCEAIYQRLAPVGANKAAIVGAFVSEAQCTAQGANTYFLTCKKKYGTMVIAE